MTISTTSDRITYQGNGSNTAFTYAFLIPEAADVVVTVTTISDSSTSELATSAYSITGLGEAAGGIVTYPLSGSPLSSLYNITVQRVLPEVQDTDLVNQSGYYPDVVEDALDYLTMCVQQLQGDVNMALAFPVGSSATDTAALMVAILNGAANATAAAASAVAAAASAATVLSLLPLATANIGNLQVTSGKLAANAVTAAKIGTDALAQGATLVNGYLVESHVASAATFAIKTLAGADPSATDPVYAIFRSVTPGTGSYTVRTITAALSLTISSGSTMGFTNSIAGRLWLVLFDDSGVIRLGAINCRSGTNIYALSGYSIASSTAEGGGGAADSAQVFYTMTAVAAKPYITVGYMTWETGLAAVGTWDASPTRINSVRIGEALPGSVIQQPITPLGTVATGTTITPWDNTIPTSVEGDSQLSRAITPTSAANILEIDVQTFLSNSAGTQLIAALFQDAGASAICVGCSRSDAGTRGEPQLMKYRMVAGTTISTTFAVRVGCPTAGTTTINGESGTVLFGGVLNSFLKAAEMMA